MMDNVRERNERKMRARSSGSVTIALVVILSICILPVFIVGCGGEDEAGEASIDETWQKAGEADKNITSWHMEIASYYQNTQYGSGQIQSIIIDANGDDIHEQDLLLGQVYSEYIRVGDKQYNKDMTNQDWVEVPVTAGDNAETEYVSQFLELPSKSASQEYIRTETIDEKEAEHFRFTLSPLRVINMFAAGPSFDFTENTGGQVDVWIDKNDYYMVRYEIVINNVIIPEEIGCGDIKFTVNISKINENIEITPPV